VNPYRSPAPESPAPPEDTPAPVLQPAPRTEYDFLPRINFGVPLITLSVPPRRWLLANLAARLP